MVHPKLSEESSLWTPPFYDMVANSREVEKSFRPKIELLIEKKKTKTNRYYLGEIGWMKAQ